MFAPPTAIHTHGPGLIRLLGKVSTIMMLWTLINTNQLRNRPLNDGFHTDDEWRALECGCRGLPIIPLP